MGEKMSKQIRINNSALGTIKNILSCTQGGYLGKRAKSEISYSDLLTSEL